MTKSFICFVLLAVSCFLCTSASSQELSYSEVRDYWEVHGYSGAPSSIYQEHPGLLGSAPFYGEPKVRSYDSRMAFQDQIIYQSIAPVYIDSDFYNMHGFVDSVPLPSDLLPTSRLLPILYPLRDQVHTNSAPLQEDMEIDWVLYLPGASGASRLRVTDLPFAPTLYRVYRDEFGSVGSWDGFTVSPSTWREITGRSPPVDISGFWYLDDSVLPFLRNNIRHKHTVRFTSPSSGGVE